MNRTTYKKKEFNWGLASSSRSLVYDVGKPGQQVGMELELELEVELELEFPSDLQRDEGRVEGLNIKTLQE